MGLLIRKSLLAEVMGFSRSYVSQLIRSGILKPLPDGRLDAREAIESLYKFRNRPKKKYLRSPPVGDLNIDVEGLLKSLPKTRKEGSKAQGIPGEPNKTREEEADR